MERASYKMKAKPETVTMVQYISERDMGHVETVMVPKRSEGIALERMPYGIHAFRFFDLTITDDGKRTYSEYSGVYYTKGKAMTVEEARKAFQKTPEHLMSIERIAREGAKKVLVLPGGVFHAFREQDTIISGLPSNSLRRNL